MTVSTQERIIWIVILFLAVLLGYKVGQRTERQQLLLSIQHKQSKQVEMTNRFNQTSSEHVASSQEVQEPSRPSLLCPPLSCPPCECKPVSKPKLRKNRRKKPPPIKASSPVDRQKLLAWVKKYSPRLKRCRDAGQPIYKLHTQVTLNAEKDRILRVKVKGVNVPIHAVKCVERDLRKWPAPAQLSVTHPPLLIFGLQLD